jgi:hypothetical protein
MKNSCPNGSQFIFHCSRLGMIVYIASLATGLLLFSSCKSDMAAKPRLLCSQGYGVLLSPTNFVHQIAKTDHIVVTNRINSPYTGFSFTISGRRMKEVIHTVSLAQGCGYQHSASVFDWQLQFFQLTNLLGAANFQGSAFIIGMRDMEYFDESGVLDKLYNEILEKTDPLLKKAFEN